MFSKGLVSKIWLEPNQIAWEKEFREVECLQRALSSGLGDFQHILRLTGCHTGWEWKGEVIIFLNKIVGNSSWAPTDLIFVL